ncbi:hypothetical protein ACFL6I_15500 [candidate division KSB1 bacterium]
MELQPSVFDELQKATAIQEIKENAHQAFTIEDRVLIYKDVLDLIKSKRTTLQEITEGLNNGTHLINSTTKGRQAIINSLKQHFPPLAPVLNASELKEWISQADTPEKRELALSWYQQVLRENLEDNKEYCPDRLDHLNEVIGLYETEPEEAYDKFADLFTELKNDDVPELEHILNEFRPDLFPPRYHEDVNELKEMAMMANFLEENQLAKRIRAKIRIIGSRKESFSKKIKFKKLDTVVGGGCGSGVNQASKESPDKVGDISEQIVIERSTYAAEALEELGIDASKCKFLEGAEELEAMQTKEYRVIVIPELDKTIFVCDYGNNKTFILHSASLVEEYAPYKKYQWEQLTELGHMTGLIWQEPKERWKAKLKTLLTLKMKKIDKSISADQLPEPEEYDPEWATASGLAIKLGIGQLTVVRYADYWREDNPEWFKPRLDSQGKIRQHISPEFIWLLKTDLEHYPPAPEDWITNRALGLFIKEAYPKIKNIFGKVKKIAEGHWKTGCCKRLRTKNGHKCVHYSPELISVIIDEIVKKELTSNHNNESEI